MNYYKSWITSLTFNPVVFVAEFFAPKIQGAETDIERQENLAIVLFFALSCVLAPDYPPPPII